MKEYISNDISGIADKETYLAVKNGIHGRIGAYFTDKINLKKASKTETLLLEGKYQVLNLDFLRFFPDLDFLSVGSDRLIDISGLQFAPKLTTLILIRNNFTDFRPISYCTRLEYLILNSKKPVQSSNLRELGRLTRLRDISLDGGDISDISWASTLTELEVFCISNNQVQDFNHLLSLPKLKTIIIDDEIYEAPFGSPPF